ncbi:MAG: 4Fe-4S binding protein [Actinobacteria bacterium]|nr:4Fe-4S binding protein [Actinomycetota bacterium]
MATREMIRIDESLCNGCGLCVPACAEGALEIVDGKARIAAEFYCDGLGACLGECPEGALTIEVREAAEFDEVAVEARLRELGRPSLAASGHDHSNGHAAHGHTAHAAQHQAAEAPAAHVGCPGSLARDMRRPETASARASTAQPDSADQRPAESLLQNWPVQLGLVNPNAPFLQNADLLIAADCAPFAYRDFHSEFLEGRSLVIACPKLDDAQAHLEKLAMLFHAAQPRSVSVVRMEVPCCGGLVALATRAADVAGLKVPVEEIVVSIGGERLSPATAAR